MVFYKRSPPWAGNFVERKEDIAPNKNGKLCLILIGALSEKRVDENYHPIGYLF